MQVDRCAGHARLMEPPSRASMWRAGFDNPADFNDNQGYCGGFMVSGRLPSLGTRFVRDK